MKGCSAFLMFLLYVQFTDAAKLSVGTSTSVEATGYDPRQGELQRVLLDVIGLGDGDDYGDGDEEEASCDCLDNASCTEEGVCTCDDGFVDVDEICKDETTHYLSWWVGKTVEGRSLTDLSTGNNYDLANLKVQEVSADPVQDINDDSTITNLAVTVSGIIACSNCEPAEPEMSFTVTLEYATFTRVDSLAGNLSPTMTFQGDSNAETFLTSNEMELKNPQETLEEIKFVINDRFTE